MSNSTFFITIALLLILQYIVGGIGAVFGTITGIAICQIIIHLIEKKD